MEPALKRGRIGFSTEDESLRSAIAIAISRTQRDTECGCEDELVRCLVIPIPITALNRFFAWRHGEGPTFGFWIPLDLSLFFKIIILHKYIIKKNIIKLKEK